MAKPTQPQIQKMIQDAFRFLVEDLNFEKWSEVSDDVHVETTYRKKATAVKVGLEWRDRYLYVEFFDATGEQTLPNIFKQRRRFNFDDLLTIRSPTAIPIAVDYDDALRAANVRHLLNEYAAAIRSYGTDLLDGDWSIYPQIREIIEKRQSQDRQLTNSKSS